MKEKRKPLPLHLKFTTYLLYLGERWGAWMEGKSRLGQWILGYFREELF